jgi:two-component system sensor histidine kinase/response regulator
MAGDRDACLAAGMNDHVAKPIEPRDLWAALRAWLRPRPGLGRRGSEVPPADAADGAPRPQSAAPALDLAARLAGVAGLDAEAGLRRVLGKEAVYLSLLRQFVNGHRDDAAAVRAALAAGDAATAERLAHTVKGVAGNLGADGVAAAAASLEAGLRAGESDAAQAGKLAELASAIAALVSALEAHLPDMRQSPQTVPSAQPQQS